ncbi:MAG: hypothetical protein QOG15_2266 [Solirubrobacteraceae bacterium]|nr:hypothetical protein [Solirubrobacteraceae bacterium]
MYFEGYGPYQADPQFTPTPPGVAAKVAALPSRAAAGALEIVWRDRVAAALDDFYAAPAGGALLDYGCGSTAFLDRAAAAGWRTVGADFSSAIVDAVATHGHRAVLVGASFDAEVEDASIDRARMNHVIEHLYDPGAALRAIHTKLKPGGLIHIATPNPEAFGSALFGTRWFALDCPRHAIMFPPHALSRLSVACGFSDPVVLHEVGPKDLSRSIGIVRYERGRLAHEQIAGLAAERYRAMALALPSKVAALAGRADRFHLLARA